MAPRHPPSALCSLTTTATHQVVRCNVARAMSWPARVATQVTLTPGESPNGTSPKANPQGSLGVWDYLVHNSAKLKILQSADIYPVVKVRPLAGSRRNLADPVPSDPLVGGERTCGSLCTDQRSDVGVDTKRRLVRRAAVSSVCARARWGCAPRYSLSARCLPGQRFFLQVRPEWWRRGDSNS